MEMLKTRLEIEHDRFKVFISLASVIAGGSIGLLFKEKDPVAIGIIITGAVLSVITFSLALRSFLRVNRILSSMEEVNKND